MNVELRLSIIEQFQYLQLVRGIGILWAVPFKYLAGQIKLTVDTNIENCYQSVIEFRRSINYFGAHALITFFSEH